MKSKMNQEIQAILDQILKITSGRVASDANLKDIGKLSIKLMEKLSEKENYETQLLQTLEVKYECPNCNHKEIHQLINKKTLERIAVYKVLCGNCNKNFAFRIIVE